ncbi:hypothetical protein L3X38_017340 [Prunus dulcis]|uniref:Uncharacterized protein n=1 Tax=Prunus dulcis TaxID=3755 RepID=A0AAD4W749_PRUDU|nr:hypothetical protein L3X38_017340 [Prunus dulcis]
MMSIDHDVEDLRVLCSMEVLLPRTVGYTYYSWTSANGADYINLPICFRNQRLRWLNNVLIQLTLPNQSLNDFSQTYAFFGIVAVVLVVPAELSSIQLSC